MLFIKKLKLGKHGFFSKDSFQIKIIELTNV